MTDFILAYIAYAAQGPQECLVAMCLPGFFMMCFGKKLPANPPRNAQVKTAQRRVKKGKKAKVVKPPKKAKEQGGGEAKLVERELSREEMDRLDRYYSERRI